MSPDTRAIQDDDGINPGMFSVLDGEGLWNKKDGVLSVSCDDCHSGAKYAWDCCSLPSVRR